MTPRADSHLCSLTCFWFFLPYMLSIVYTGNIMDYLLVRAGICFTLWGALRRPYLAVLKQHCGVQLACWETFISYLYWGLFPCSTVFDSLSWLWGPDVRFDIIVSLDWNLGTSVTFVRFRNGQCSSHESCPVNVICVHILTFWSILKGWRLFSISCGTHFSLSNLMTSLYSTL